MASPIIQWLGGKRRLADKLLPYFPEHDCYVEVFSGGAALFFLREQPAKGGRVMVSINDHPDIRRVFAGQHMRELSIRYSVAKRRGTPVESGELMITNYEPVVRGGLF